MMIFSLFFSFFQIGLLSFGGGYAALPMIQHQVVDLHGWLSMTEFTDLITISQMTPGPIAINAATFVGIKIAGPIGAMAATTGCVLPSCVIVTVIAWFYLRYRQMEGLQIVLNTLRPAVIALIAVSGVTILAQSLFGGVSMSWENFHIGQALIFLICLYLLIKKQKNPIFVMVLAGVLNTVGQLLWK